MMIHQPGSKGNLLVCIISLLNNLLAVFPNSLFKLVGAILLTHIGLDKGTCLKSVTVFPLHCFYSVCIRSSFGAVFVKLKV